MTVDTNNILGIARIPSKLYASLFQAGGDNLLSVYATLKLFKGRQVKYKAYKANNNKFVGGYSLLRAKTNISLKTLKTYVPQLVDMGVLSFHSNGDVLLLGNNKLKSLYGVKLVPMAVCTKLIGTRYASVSVRLHSAERAQRKMIDKKADRRELLLQGKEGVRSLKQLKAYNKVIKKYSLATLNYTDQTVLSIQGYAVLKDGTVNNKSKGNYWKRVLKQKGLVTSKRRFQLLPGLGLNLGAYKFMKRQGALPNNVLYCKGRMIEELCSSFSPINIVDSFNNLSSLSSSLEGVSPPCNKLV